MTRWIIELSQTTKIQINPIYIPPAKFNRSCGRNKKCCFSMQLMLRLKIGCTKSSRQWIVQVAALQIIWDIFGQFQSLWKFPQHPPICWKLFLLAANIPPTGKLNAAKVELWWIVEVGASRCNFLHSSPPEISWITNFSYNYSQMRTIISNWHFLSPQRKRCHFCPLPYFPCHYVWKEYESQDRRPDSAWWGKREVKFVPPAAAASCLSCHSSAYNSSLTPQAVVVVVVVVAVVELVVTLAITALTPQTALSAVTHHWSRVVERNQPTCPTYTGGGSRKQTRTGSILS